MTGSRMQAEPVELASSDSIELLGRAIHRVRNLLMSVRGYAELIAIAPDGNPEHQRWAGRIVEQVDRLEALQSRVDGAMRLDPQISFHSMATVTRAALERSDARVEPDARAIQVQLLVRDDRVVQADGEDLAEAIAALLDNAREAAAQSGRQAVEVVLEADVPGSWILQIIDRGEGLGDRRRLGEAFFTRKAGHLGLGIFLSRSLLERHGMQLDFDRSDPDRTVATIRERRMPAGGIR